MRNAGNASDFDKSGRVKWFKKKKQKKRCVDFNFTWNKCLKSAFEGKKGKSS